MTTTLRVRRSTLARARCQRDYLNPAFAVQANGDGYQLTYHGRPTILRSRGMLVLLSYDDRDAALKAASMLNRSNPYDRIHSRKTAAIVARMAF
jgi:hypothetical protein